MKIVCDECGAKYSIADEKVAGKVFKIRCKRCSNVIVVRGETEAATDAPTISPGQDQPEQKETRVFDYSGYDNPAEAAAASAAEPVWHVVIDQEQIGPMTAADVGDRFRQGQLDSDSYTWKEGFDDWQRLADIAEFAALFAGDAPAGGDSGLFGGPEVDAGETGQTDPADVFAAATASSSASAEPGADLFAASPEAQQPAASEESENLFGGQAASAASDDSPRLRGERNENSVLFSLSNLASLAEGDSGGGAPTAGAAASDGGPSQTTATQEGSGLIDIRSMAQVYLGGESGGAAASSGGVGSDDDIPSFGASSFGAPASPMLLPVAPAASGDKKLLYALIGAIGLLLVVGVVLVILVVKGGDEKVVATADGEQTAAAAIGSDDSTGDSETGDPAPAGGGDSAGGDVDKAEGDSKEEPAPAAAAPADGDTGGNDVKPPTQVDTSPPKERAARKRPASGRDSRRGRRPSPPEPKKEASPPKAPASSGSCDEVTCLVEPNKACCKKYRSSGGSRGGSNSNLKERPTKSDVKSGISKVMGRVKACGGRHGGSGVVKVKVKVAGSGRVSSANPSPASALGKCVATAVRRARFPRTQRGVTFTYPFRF